MASRSVLTGDEEKMTSDAENYPSFRWLVLILASLGLISMQLVNLSVAPLVPLIASSLHTDPGPPLIF